MTAAIKEMFEPRFQPHALQTFADWRASQHLNVIAKTVLEFPEADAKMLRDMIIQEHGADTTFGQEVLKVLDTNFDPTLLRADEIKDNKALIDAIESELKKYPDLKTPWNDMKKKFVVSLRNKGLQPEVITRIAKSTLENQWERFLQSQAFVAVMRNGSKYSTKGLSTRTMRDTSVDDSFGDNAEYMGRQINRLGTHKHWYRKA